MSELEVILWISVKWHDLKRFQRTLLNMSKKTLKNIQQILFGGLENEQIQQTYYNHPPRTLYERFVEACYYFNKEIVGRKE